MSQLGRAAIKTKIDNWIKTNGLNDITGAQLNEVLTDMADSLLDLIDDKLMLGLSNYNPAFSYTVGMTVVRNGVIFQANTTATGTWDPTKWLVISGRVVLTNITNDDTPVAIDTITIPDGTTLKITINSVARRIGGTAGSSGDSAVETGSVTYKAISGALTLVLSTMLHHTDNLIGGITFTTSGNDLIIYGQGAVDNDIRWQTTVEYLGVSQTSVGPPPPPTDH